MNIWAKIGIGAAAATGIGYLMKMSRTSAELETVSSAMVHKVDFSGITVRVDTILKNPTKGSFSIKYPFVKLIYKNSTIGSSQAIDKDILVPKYGEARVEQMMIKIPVFSLLSVGTDLFKAISEGKGVKVGVKTISTIDLGFKSVPYEKTEEIILKK